MLSVFLNKAQTQFDETRHAEPNAALGDQLANATRHAEPNAALGDQLAKDSNALETSKADTAEWSPALPAEKEDLAVTE